MITDTRFWYLFGGIWLLVGTSFIAMSLGVALFVDPALANEDGPPLWVFALVGLVCAGAGGGIIYRVRTTIALDRYLMQSGLAHTAVVTDIRRGLIEINRQSRWNVCYRYDFGGRTLEGKSRALPGAQVADFKPGQGVRIKLDPQKPEDSLFIGAA